MRCAADINECESNPCLNGGNCTDLLAAYTCHCIDGYSGTNCETGMFQFSAVTVGNVGLLR